VDGTRFMLGGGGRAISSVGFNAYWLLLVASKKPARRGKAVLAALHQAASHGLNLARTWAFSDGRDTHTPRQYVQWARDAVVRTRATYM
jgi:mannan endo-1,4-beta-mannosidase